MSRIYSSEYPLITSRSMLIFFLNEPGLNPASKDFTLEYPRVTSRLLHFALTF